MPKRNCRPTALGVLGLLVWLALVGLAFDQFTKWESARGPSVPNAHSGAERAPRLQILQTDGADRTPKPSETGRAEREGWLPN